MARRAFTPGLLKEGDQTGTFYDRFLSALPKARLLAIDLQGVVNTRSARSKEEHVEDNDWNRPDSAGNNAHHARNQDRREGAQPEPLV
jgi:hypothetical protein